MMITAKGKDKCYVMADSCIPETLLSVRGGMGQTYTRKLELSAVCAVCEEMPVLAHASSK